ncbi:MAG TPA: alpha/beta hydrolase-fold protein [Terriglobia bacterium]|jgi:S-formylglutathione hydrolase FrmB
MKSMHFRILLACILMMTAAGLVLAKEDGQTAKKGMVQHIKIHGKALEGNLEGETADPDVTIYLPPDYETSKKARYPVIYLLHGYSGTDATWTGRIANVPEAMDRDIAANTSRGMIVVMPNANTKYGGSMYSNSVTTGNWESYIAEDLVSYMDKNYRTIPDRMSRGIAGHSMGGYGAVRIAMKRPDVFSSLYILSACCLMNNPGGGGNRGAAPRGDGARGATPRVETPAAGANRGAAPRGGAGNRGGGGFANVQFAEAAAWSPNPGNPPNYYDLPTKDGQPQPLIVAKWVANSPLAMLDQYVGNLKKFHAIAGDVGTSDSLMASNKQLEEAFTNFGIHHKFETYDGDHTNHVKDRIEMSVLPFFSQSLIFKK